MRGCNFIVPLFECFYFFHHSETCEDSYVKEKCNDLKSAGACLKRPLFMKHVCPATCGFCRKLFLKSTCSFIRTVRFIFLTPCTQAYLQLGHSGSSPLVIQWQGQRREMYKIFVVAVHSPPDWMTSFCSLLFIFPPQCYLQFMVKFVGILFTVVLLFLAITKN